MFSVALREFAFHKHLEVLDALATLCEYAKSFFLGWVGDSIHDDKEKKREKLSSR